MMTFLGPKQTEEVRGGLTLAVYVRTYIYAAMRRAETGNMETPQNRGTNSDRQVQEQQTSRPAASARASTRCLSTQLPAGPAPCTLPTQLAAMIQTDGGAGAAQVHWPRSKPMEAQARHACKKSQETALATGAAGTMMATVIGKGGCWRHRGQRSCGRRGRYVPASSSQSPRPLTTSPPPVPSLSLPPPPRVLLSTPISPPSSYTSQERGTRCVALHGSATHTPCMYPTHRGGISISAGYARSRPGRVRACVRRLHPYTHIRALAGWLAELRFGRPSLATLRARAAPAPVSSRCRPSC
jgi:hypothetical protein